MALCSPPEPSASQTTLDNAVLGQGTIVEPGVVVGYRYHSDCGAARIGAHGILRQGTIIYGDVAIGDHFQTGHYALIRAKVRMGDYCCIFHRATVEGIVRMGDGVRIMAHVYIPSRTWFGDHIFVGPGVSFLNDRTPGRYATDNVPTPRGATIEDHVVIGGGATILPGVTIGAQSFVGAGALVNKDVPPRSLVVGVPGRARPLPSYLDRPNCQELTMAPLDLWHPLLPNLHAIDWPEEWGAKTYKD